MANLPSNDSLAPQLLGLGGSLLVLSIILLCARLWSRRRGFKADDWTLLAGAVLYPATLEVQDSLTSPDSRHRQLPHTMRRLFPWLRAPLQIRLSTRSHRRPSPRLCEPNHLVLGPHARQTLSRASASTPQTQSLMAHLRLQYHKHLDSHAPCANTLPLPAMPAIQHLLGPISILQTRWRKLYSPRYHNCKHHRE
jgi:hypothetical protein